LLQLPRNDALDGCRGHFFVNSFLLKKRIEITSDMWIIYGNLCDIALKITGMGAIICGLSKREDSALRESPQLRKYVVPLR
jgi:hypothetical protein